MQAHLSDAYILCNAHFRCILGTPARRIARQTLSERMLDFKRSLKRRAFCAPPMTVNDPRLIEEIGARLSKVLANSPARDVEKNVRALMLSFFERFDLVTRDDFEVQKRVLERAQARISELEERLARLEAPTGGGEARAS